MSTMLATAAPTRSPRRVGLLALASAVLALAAVGVVLATAMLTGGAEAEDSGPALPEGPFGVAQDIPTSFGFVAVEHAERLGGLTAKALAGAVHGISGYVPPDKLQLQASVTLTNLTTEAVAYTPAQFSLVAARDVEAAARTRRALSPVSSSIKPGHLQPDAAVDARVSFVAPRDGKRLYLRFRDPGRARPVVIDLGRTSGRTPKAALNEHIHGFQTAPR